MLNDLYVAREEVDYDGMLANDEALARQWEFKVSLLLKKVRKNTPVYQYPEFIRQFFIDNLFSGYLLMALEFDFYCPKSYIHKERVQFQCKADTYTEKTPQVLKTAGARATKLLKAHRQDDYVLGWNNRLGQSGDGYLLFLDIDEIDEGKVKAALKDRKGWLFKTGNGFHFVGAKIYPSKKEWERRYKQAANSKKLKNLIDKRHVDFSLRRGYSTLRTDKSAEKAFVPFMCWDNSK